MNHLETELQRIGEKVRGVVLEPSLLEKEISIFLCGGAQVAQNRFRKELGRQLVRAKSKYSYKVVYPEHLFLDLLLSHEKHDLLSLETLLAESVNAVAILLQSPGTFAELGAFTAREGLNNKLIVLIPEQFKNSKSFINTGPVAFLKRYTQSHIYYFQPDSINYDELKKKISGAAREIASRTSVLQSLMNPLLAYKFVLALVYVFSPIHVSRINSLISFIEPISSSRDRVRVSVEAALRSLIYEGIVRCSHDIYEYNSGKELSFFRNQELFSSWLLERSLVRLRLSALNLTLRGRHYHEWAKSLSRS